MLNVVVLLHSDNILSFLRLLNHFIPLGGNQDGTQRGTTPSTFCLLWGLNQDPPAFQPSSLKSVLFCSVPCGSYLQEQNINVVCYFCCNYVTLCQYGSFPAVYHTKAANLKLEICLHSRFLSFGQHLGGSLTCLLHLHIRLMLLQGCYNITPPWLLEPRSRIPPPGLLLTRLGQSWCLALYIAVLRVRRVFTALLGCQRSKNTKKTF